MTIGQPQPTREEIARIEVGHTDVGRATIRFLLAGFLAVIAGVPLFELVAPPNASADERPWRQLTTIVDVPSDRPQATASLWDKLIAANRSVLRRMTDFEDALEDQSRIGHLVRPASQVVLTRWLRTGNETAYVGRDGWLFYRLDVEYVTGPDFLDERAGARRVASTSEWLAPPATNPLPAILELKRQLDANGTTLVLVPTPVKPSVHPEHLSRTAAHAKLPLQNPSYERLLDELRRAGVLVFDPAAAMVEAARMASAPQYLATDTHWRPEAMEMVAERLGEFLRMHVTLPPAGDAAYATQGAEVQHMGDIAEMLDLPAGQTIYPPETVAIRRVVHADGSPWRPSRDADILLLGDSFSNMYSLASMGWGDSAGFAEHLSYVLQRPVDRIVQNDRGAYATRELLHRAGPERLAGKRVVIYQFATRELSLGDWRVFTR